MTTALFLALRRHSMSKSDPNIDAGRDQGLRTRIVEEGKRGLVVRDSFTMPVADYEMIGALKRRCLGLGIAVKKSELLRAGLATLQRLSDESLAQVVDAVESVKTGRPPGKNKKSRMKAKAKANQTKGRKQ
jgi:hypothetical protein